MMHNSHIERNLLFHDEMYGLYNSFRFVEIMRVCRSRLRKDFENPFLWYWLSLSADALQNKKLACRCAEKVCRYVDQVPSDLKSDFLLWILHLVDPPNKGLVKAIHKEASKSILSVSLRVHLLLGGDKPHYALKLLQRIPLTPESIYLKSLCYHHLSQVNIAIAEMKKGITMFPNSYFLHSYLAYLLISEKHFDDALDIVERLIDIDRCEPQLLGLGAEICFLKGYWFRAIFFFVDEVEHQSTYYLFKGWTSLLPLLKSFYSAFSNLYLISLCREQTKHNNNCAVLVAGSRPSTT